MDTRDCLDLCIVVPSLLRNCKNGGLFSTTRKTHAKPLMKISTKGEATRPPLDLLPCLKRGLRGGIDQHC